MSLFVEIAVIVIFKESSVEFVKYFLIFWYIIKGRKFNLKFF